MTRELTQYEKAKSYSKYYYQALAKPAENQLKALEKPMNPGDALLPDGLGRMLEPGYFPVESGYCQMPDGSVYVANLTPMPGVTIEMLDWWFAWHPLEDLRYMIWHPGAHYGIKVSGETRRRILSPGTSLRDKLRGATHRVLEDTGEVGYIDISFLAPEQMGLTDFPEDGGVTLIGANGLSWGKDAPEDAPKAPAVMCHLARETAEGIELRTRFWMGWQFADKKPVKIIPDTVRIPDLAGKALLFHGIEEYTNLAAILPGLFKEMNGEITA